MTTNDQQSAASSQPRRHRRTASASQTTPTAATTSPPAAPAKKASAPRQDPQTIVADPGSYSWATHAAAASRFARSAAATHAESARQLREKQQAQAKLEEDLAVAQRLAEVEARKQREALEAEQQVHTREQADWDYVLSGQRSTPDTDDTTATPAAADPRFAGLHQDLKSGVPALYAVPLSEIPEAEIRSFYGLPADADVTNDDVMKGAITGKFKQVDTRLDNLEAAVFPEQATPSTTDDTPAPAPADSSEDKPDDTTSTDESADTSEAPAKGTRTVNITGALKKVGSFLVNGPTNKQSDAQKPGWNI
jgi:hypothetical protein